MEGPQKAFSNARRACKEEGKTDFAQKPARNGKGRAKTVKTKTDAYLKGGEQKGQVISKGGRRGRHTALGR